MDIFVFGSNLAGRHGRGAALHARRKHGAIYGKGVGLHGLSYAIPTKDHDIRVLSLSVIERHVETFKKFAAEHPDFTFKVTAIGCGLAGYTPKQIAPMFKDATGNVHLPVEFGGSLDWSRDHAMPATPPQPEDALRRGESEGKLWAIKLASGDLLLNDARDFHRGPWIWERKEAAEEALTAARAAKHQYAESALGWRMARVVPVLLQECEQ